MVDAWVMSIDVGTTSVKTAAITLDGAALATARAHYPTTRPRPNHVEQNPAEWWLAVCGTASDVLRSPAVDPAGLVGVGLSGMAASHVLLDARQNVVRRAIIWQDTRATREAADLRDALGAAELRRCFGANLAMTASSQAARMLWLHRHEHELFSSVRHVIGSKDYVLLCLTGSLATDRTSNSEFVNLVTGELHPAIAEATGFDPRLLPNRLEPHAVGGTVTKSAEAATGIPAGTPVAVGMTDSWCNILGVGVTRPGQAFDIAGTAEVVGLAIPPPTAASPGTVGRRFLTGVDVSYGVTQCGTDALTWFAEAFADRGVHDLPSADGSVFSLLDEAASSAAVGSDGLVFLPYLVGERSPFSDPQARGGFHGAHRSHRRPHFIRSVLEGVAFSVRHVLEACEASGGGSADVVTVSSGGSRSALWNRIKADVLGRPLNTLSIADAGSVGASILAAVATGRYTMPAAIQHMVRVQETVLPDLRNHAAYDELYGIYLDIGTRLNDVHHRLADFQLRSRSNSNAP